MTKKKTHQFSVGVTSSSAGWVYASTDSSFSMESMRPYSYIDIENEEDTQRVTCPFCATINVVDVNEKGTLRCGACGGQLSLDDEDEEEVKQVHFKEYKPTWLERFFHKEYRNTEDD